MLDYECNKNHYKLIALDLRRQKHLDADPKAIRKIEFTGQFKNADGQNADGTQSMFVFTILEKIKETKLKFSQGNANGLIKEGEL